MLSRLASVLTLPPELLLQHLDGYGKLAAQALDSCTSHWRRQLLLSAVGIGCLLVSTTLVGTAAMLWATAAAPLASDGALADSWSANAWVLVAVPLLPLLAAIGSFWLLARSPEDEPLATLRAQLRLDAELLRDVAGSGVPVR